ncbi:Selenide%2C water dikinase [uncultured Roseburia sp.]|nr:Selenide%2C water dikinase [uncultured Roseburia sp.]
MGIETSDDAAIYKVTEEIALIQTLDFFTPVVDDPYTFGQIAAANSLSDIYAMGGEPKIALNIVGFPNCLDPEILGEILAGGADKVKEAGAVLVGGHSVQDDEPKYGLSVTGFVHPDKILKNYGSRPGDVLILTKQIGSGIINTAIKAEMASDGAVKEAVQVMTSLNKKAKEVLEQFPVHACTDITGFGLLGHCVEMAEASDVTFMLDVRSIPYMEEAADYAKMGLIPAGAYRNREYFIGKADCKKAEEFYVDLLCDPQTSGGLLVSVAPDCEKELLDAFRQSNIDTKVSVIGRVSEMNGSRICLY